jgi:uncharacterized protein YdeI (YjbR/CyaY-like superfamily)
MPRLPANSVHPRSRSEWRRWLARNHARTTGVWLVSFKRSTGKKRVEYDAAVEEALCYGWIDSKAVTVDDERTMQWFAPRKRGSSWAASNKARVRRAIAAGIMTPAGLAKIAAARKDGSWNALDGIDRMQVPADLRRALAARKRARGFFDRFPPSVKRGLLYWVSAARRAETRARRVNEIARLAARNIRANEWRPRE